MNLRKILCFMGWHNFKDPAPNTKLIDTQKCCYGGGMRFWVCTGCGKKDTSGTWVVNT